MTTVVSEDLLRDRMRDLLTAAYAGLPIPVGSQPLVTSSIRNGWITTEHTITDTGLALLGRLTASTEE